MSMARLDLCTTIQSPRMFLVPEQACLSAAWLLCPLEQPYSTYTRMLLLLSGKVTPGVSASHLALPERQQHGNHQSKPIMQQIWRHVSRPSCTRYLSLPRVITIFPSGCPSQRDLGVPLGSSPAELCLLVTTVACLQSTDLPAEDAVVLSHFLGTSGSSPTREKASSAQEPLARRGTPTRSDTAGPRARRRAVESYTTEKHRLCLC